MKNEHERHTAFLRECILYDHSLERQNLAERINQLQQNERCVRRASWLMLLLGALAFAGLCYSLVLLREVPQNLQAVMTHGTLKVFCVVGLGASICTLAFAALGMSYRRELNEQREECRRLTSQFMETRLGKP